MQPPPETHLVLFIFYFHILFQDTKIHCKVGKSSWPQTLRHQKFHMQEHCSHIQLQYTPSHPVGGTPNTSSNFPFALACIDCLIFATSFPPTVSLSLLYYMAAPRHDLSCTKIPLWKTQYHTNTLIGSEGLSFQIDFESLSGFNLPAPLNPITRQQLQEKDWINTLTKWVLQQIYLPNNLLKHC